MEERPLSLVEWAYKEIKEKIFNGGLKSGQKIIVSPLATDLNISPTPVKEALNRLVAEGLLTTLPHRGFMVKALTPETIKDAIECRIMIETFCAQSACENFHTDLQLTGMMSDTLLKYEGLDPYNYIEAIQLERTFHRAYVQLSHNQRLLSLYDLLWGVEFSYYIYSSTDHPLVRHQEALKEHKQIYEYLNSGNAMDLELLIKYHLNKILELYQGFLSHS